MNKLHALFSMDAGLSFERRSGVSFRDAYIAVHPAYLLPAETLWGQRRPKLRQRIGS
ncbi:MAG: hypothetical protein KTR25_11705 [Myxococcales bacterium]|nr:hypothetical protein [Myxococcales bacterium]